ncbi:MAG: hypothetical protein JWP91_641 [Fibrobacteres bacterium]|nr:hypothetical protein [Fibrobacterota bacterium]
MGTGADRVMDTGIKVQIVFAIFLSMELLALYMIIIRTVANLEYAFNRIEAIVNREIQISLKTKEQDKLTKEKAQQNDMSKNKKNDLLLNIPFMERLNKDKEKKGKDGHA